MQTKVWMCIFELKGDVVIISANSSDCIDFMYVGVYQANALSKNLPTWQKKKKKSI